MKMDKAMLDDDLKHLHEKTLDILDNKGIQIKDDEILDSLEERGVPCDRSEYMVRFSPAMVEEAIKNAPEEVKLGAPDPELVLNLKTNTRLKFMASGTGAFAIDTQTHKRRPSTEADVIQMVKLQQSIKTVDVARPVFTATDNPPQFADLIEFKNGLMYSQKHLHHRTISSKNNKPLLDMLEVISGSKAEIRNNPLISVNCCPMSPLVISADTARSMLQFSEAGIPVKVLSMAIGGASTPASIFGTALATNVEIVGAIALIQTVNPGAPVLYSSVSSVIDMKTSILAVGAPERSIINRLLARLATSYYRIPCVMGGLSTDSKYMDFQCGFEKAITTLPLLDYTNMVSGMALLNSASTYSVEQLIYDAEIAEAMKKYKLNENLSDGNEECELIKKVGPMGHFLLEDHTAEHFRDFWQPAFMNRTCGFSPDEEYAYISDKMNANLASYDETVCECNLDEKTLAEIKNIYEVHCDKNT